MNATVIALVVWLALTLASIWVWIPDRRARPLMSRTPALVVVLATEVVVTAVVALLVGLGPPLLPPASWFAIALAGLAALLSGGAVVFVLLALADTASRTSGAARVQRNVLRGGAWIGALERLALFGTVVAGWPEGIVAIVAVKAFARYPELKTGQGTGAVERFIVGTFSSLGWAGVCAGIAMIFR